MGRLMAMKKWREEQRQRVIDAQIILDASPMEFHELMVRKRRWQRAGGNERENRFQLVTRALASWHRSRTFLRSDKLVYE